METDEALPIRGTSDLTDPAALWAEASMVVGWLRDQLEGTQPEVKSLVAYGVPNNKVCHQKEVSWLNGSQGFHLSLQVPDLPLSSVPDLAPLFKCLI